MFYRVIFVLNIYEENVKKNPLTSDIMNNKQKLIKWVIDIHNIVNESKNKEIVPYEKALKLIDTDIKCGNKMEPFLIHIYNHLNLKILIFFICYY
jgi:hypothetical protein